MQDHLLHPLLTVEEAMSFCINLKIGKELSDHEKEDKVRIDMLFDMILSQKNIVDCRRTKYLIFYIVVD